MRRGRILQIEALRGNVDTRLRRVDAGDFDAIVLARAGLVRLGLEGRATAVLAPEVSLPAVGQGALGIECREGDARVRALLEPMNDPETAVCVAAERGVLAAVEGDCKTPLGAFAERAEETAAGVAPRLRVRAFLARPDGSGYRALERLVPWPVSESEAHIHGTTVGRELASSGA